MNLKRLCVFALVTVLVLPALSMGATFISEWYEVQNLVIDPGATLNLTQLNPPNLPAGISHADSYSTIMGYLTTGYNSGTWTGAGISSTNCAAHVTSPPATNLGILTGTEYNSFNTTPFHGITPVAADVLVQYTYVGDTNFDLNVDDNDLFALLANYSAGSSTPANYFGGDTTYDGLVDDNDLFGLLGNYPASGPAPAPEPSTFVLLAIFFGAIAWYWKRK
jgi:hypothetical protein